MPDRCRRPETPVWHRHRTCRNVFFDASPNRGRTGIAAGRWMASIPRGQNTVAHISNSLAVLTLAFVLGGCGSGDGLGVGTPAPAYAPGALARGPLPAMETTPTSVGPADTGPAGSAASVGDGTAAFGGR